MTSKRSRFWTTTTVPLMLTLGLAVLLTGGCAHLCNFQHLKSIERDKRVEAIIHRDFQYVLAASEKSLNQKAYNMTEEVRNLFPSPDHGIESDKVSKLDLILSKNPWLVHVFLFDREKPFIFRSQPQQMDDKYCREEHEILSETYRGWFSIDANTLVEGMHRKSRPYYWHTSPVKRAGGDTYLTTAFFVLPQVSKDRVVVGGVAFDPNYLQQTFFPEMLDELITENPTGEKGERLAMMIYPAEAELGREENPLVASLAGQGKPRSHATG